jgi:hypothetical protein
MDKPLESDWKLYSKRVSEWRERYLQNKNREIIGILSGEGGTPTERFWDAKKRMQEEAKILDNCFDGHGRSKMLGNLLLMRHHGMITDSDLVEFSRPLQERILEISRAWKTA